MSLIFVRKLLGSLSGWKIFASLVSTLPVMSHPKNCSFIPAAMIHRPDMSNAEWQKQLAQNRLYCQQEGYAPVPSGCQLTKCLDATLLEMMHRGKATSDVAFTFLFLRYRQHLLDWAKASGCEAGKVENIVRTVFTGFYILARMRPIQLERSFP